MFTKIYVHIVDAPHSFNERTYGGIEELVIVKENHQTTCNQQTTAGHVTGKGGGHGEFSRQQQLERKYGATCKQ